MRTNRLTLAPTPPWRPGDTFAVRLAALRTELGMNAAQISRLCGIADQTWRNWEDGVGPQDLLAAIETIVEHTGCDRDWLLYGGPLAPPADKATYRGTTRDWAVDRDLVAA